MRRSRGAVSGRTRRETELIFRKFQTTDCAPEGQKADAKVHLICPRARANQLHFCARSSPRTPNRVRAKVDFPRQFKLIWVSSPDAKKTLSENQKLW
jgi:hypothetical protein